MVETIEKKTFFNSTLKLVRSFREDISENIIPYRDKNIDNPVSKGEPRLQLLGLHNEENGKLWERYFSVNDIDHMKIIAITWMQYLINEARNSKEPWRNYASQLMGELKRRMILAGKDESSSYQKIIWAEQKMAWEVFLEFIDKLYKSERYRFGQTLLFEDMSKDFEKGKRFLIESDANNVHTDFLLRYLCAYIGIKMNNYAK